MFWFNKKHPDALYIDNRTMPPVKQTNGATIEVAPDAVMDFRKLDLPDESFKLVVFDPPHILKRGGKRSWMKEKYGELDRKTWKDDLKAGFSELFRVLKPDGVLVFKWSESDILVREILDLTTVPPLFGHRSGKAGKTLWLTFMKLSPPMIPTKMTSSKKRTVQGAPDEKWQEPKILEKGESTFRNGGGSMCGGVINMSTFKSDPEAYLMAYVMADKHFEEYKKERDEKKRHKLFDRYAQSMI
jgi:hypothetical protein